MTFDAAAISTLYDQLVSHAETLGVFEAVNPAGPWSSPPQGVWCFLNMPSIVPLPGASGLAATSVRLEFKALVGMSAVAQLSARVDQAVLAAAVTLMAAYSGALTLGGNVRDVDLLGDSGQPLSASPAYMTIESHPYRVMEVVLPLVLNDVFGQVA